MIVLKYKLKGKQDQYSAIDDAIRTPQFIRNKALRTAGHTGTYAWGDLPSEAVGVILPFNGESVNPESPVTALA